MVTFGTIHDWSLTAGTVTTWRASENSNAIARIAPESDVPPSYQQEQHLWSYRAHASDGRDMARLCFGAWDIPGVCDVDTMTSAINMHVRRHDAYHSWFEFRGDDIVRRTFADPSLIELSPCEFGEMAPDRIRNHLLCTTPSPLRWGCFTFGIIQRADHFTVYINIDHLVTDGMSAGVIFMEIHLTYASLLHGTPMTLPPPGSYRDYCARERARTSALSLDSPEIRTWIDFAALNGATLPSFPLPLGDSSVPSLGSMTAVRLMDDQQAAGFDAACEDAGTRFSGGLFACAALAAHAVTGTETYCTLTPYDTRSSHAERMTVGWFASFIPVTVPVGDMSFAYVARAAQASFDAGKKLATVPFHRALELAAASGVMRAPERAVPLVSFIDVREIPLSEQWDALNVGVYGDSRLSDQVCMWVNRFETETTLTISYPDNVIARESIERYINALTRVFAGVAAGLAVH